MRQGLLLKPFYLQPARALNVICRTVLVACALFTLIHPVNHAEAAQPALWGYHMYLAPGDYRIFPDAGSAAAFSCANISNAEGGAVESIAQDGINLSIGCSYRDVNGDERLGSGRGASSDSHAHRPSNASATHAAGSQLDLEDLCMSP